MAVTFVQDQQPKLPRPTLMQRLMDATGLTKAVRNIARGVDLNNAYFSPGNTVRDQAPSSFEPRITDFRVGYNTNIQPRVDEPVSFWDLYALAENDNITRLLIETRKDQIAALRWDIKPMENDEDATVTPDQKKRVQATKNFLKSPDGEHSFEEWVRLLLEDVLVYDAPTVYVNTDDPFYTKFQVVSGMTIKRIIDENGRTPTPPDAAFQQIVHGTAAKSFTTDEIIYKPRAIRPNRIYGMSPVQQIVLTVNLALRKQLSQLYYFSEGTIPDALITVPAEWTPNQINDFQANWDALLAGNLGQKRHAQFVPGGTKIEMTKPAVLTDEADIWFTKIRCFAFSIPHTAFDRSVNRATAQTAKAAANEEGLAPLMQWVKTFVDICIQQHLDQHDLEFQWVQDDILDPTDQVSVLDQQLRSGAISLNEYREAMGRDSYGTEGDEPMIYTANGPILLKDLIAGKVGPAAAAAVSQQQADKPAPTPMLPGGKPPAGGGKQPAAGAQGANGAKKPPAKPTGASAQPKDKTPAQQAKDAKKALTVEKQQVLQTLYVSRRLVNADELVAWAKEQGFGATLTPYDMHVTIAFSRAPVDWNMAGAAPGLVRINNGVRSVEALGDKGAVVLKFSSLQLQNRWQQLRDIGCSWDWPGFQPHVTITYNGGDVDLTNVEPYMGMLEFGPEVFSEVVEDWEKQVKEVGVDEVEIEKRRQPVRVERVWRY